MKVLTLILVLLVTAQLAASRNRDKKQQKLKEIRSKWSASNTNDKMLKRLISKLSDDDLLPCDLTGGEYPCWGWPQLDPDQYQEVQCNILHKEGKGSKKPHNRSKCGKVSAKSRLLDLLRGMEKKHDGKIVGGQDAHKNDYPWQVALGDRYYGQDCGGSLIDPEWVLTAAHCFNHLTESDDCNLVARVGEFDLYADGDHSEDIPVSTVFIHKQYERDPPTPNDIALLKLARPASVGKRNINTICLPGADDHFPVDSKCLITGWGDLTGDGDYAHKLHVAELSILDKSKACKTYIEWFGKNKLEHSICAGSVAGGVDACQGDSGGPMICKRADGSYVQAGIASGGYGCASKGFPGIYMDVKHYMPWINNIMDNY